MAAGDIGSVLDTLEYDTVMSSHNCIIRCSDTIALIFYRDEPGDQKLVTVEVDAAGAITNTVKDTLIFNGTGGYYMAIAERTPGIYVLASRMDLGSAGIGTYVASITVGTAGELPAAILDSLNIALGTPSTASIIHLYENIMVVAYADAGSSYWIATFTCSDVGAIGASLIDTERLLLTSAWKGDLVKVADGVLAVAAADNGGEGLLSTFLINSSGDITDGAHDTLVFAAASCVDPNIIHLTGDIYVITYQGAANDGYICTVSIDSAGNIGDTVIETYEYEPGAAYAPRTAKVGNSIVATVGKGASNYGRVYTIAIDGSGNITDPYLDVLIYEASATYYSDIVYMAGDIYLIAYQATGQDGFVESVDIEQPPPTAAKHLMMTGVG